MLYGHSPKRTHACGYGNFAAAFCVAMRWYENTQNSRWCSGGSNDYGFHEVGSDRKAMGNCQCGEKNATVWKAFTLPV